MCYTKAMYTWPGKKRAGARPDGNMKYITLEQLKVLPVPHLTHWGRVTHICVSKLNTIGLDNDLSPGRRQAIFGTNAGILLIRILGTNRNEILNKIHTFSFKKMYIKLSPVQWRQFWLSLNVLKEIKTNQLIWLFRMCPCLQRETF